LMSWGWVSVVTSVRHRCATGAHRYATRPPRRPPGVRGRGLDAPARPSQNVALAPASAMAPGRKARHFAWTDLMNHAMRLPVARPPGSRARVFTGTRRWPLPPCRRSFWGDGPLPSAVGRSGELKLLDTSDVHTEGKLDSLLPGAVVVVQVRAPRSRARLARLPERVLHSRRCPPLTPPARDCRVSHCGIRLKMAAAPCRYNWWECVIRGDRAPLERGGDR
jgi:hypothetical protein